MGLGWALQGSLPGYSVVAHSRDTKEAGSLNSALGVLRGVLEDQAETGRGVVAELNV